MESEESNSSEEEEKEDLAHQARMEELRAENWRLRAIMDA